MCSILISTSLYALTSSFIKEWYFRIILFSQENNWSWQASHVRNVRLHSLSLLILASGLRSRCFTILFAGEILMNNIRRAFPSLNMFPISIVQVFDSKPPNKSILPRLYKIEHKFFLFLYYTGRRLRPPSHLYFFSLDSYRFTCRIGYV